jgi:hypothetical protein
VYYLDSNPGVYEGLNTNFYGMMDQLIASKGKVFAGTYYSTFTGYINRLRGYRSQKEKLPGYEMGQIDSYYIVPKDTKYVVKEYRAPYPPYWSREFPLCKIICVLPPMALFLANLTVHCCLPCVSVIHSRLARYRQECRGMIELNLRGARQGPLHLDHVRDITILVIELTLTCWYLATVA